MAGGSVHNYLYIQILQFLSSSRCCQKFCASFRISERLHIEHCASMLGLQLRSFICNDIKTVVLFKNDCIHFLESAKCLQLHSDSRKDLFVLLRESNFIGSERELQISPDFFSSSNIKPTVQPHRFSLGLLKQSMLRQNEIGQKKFQKICLLTPFKFEILKAIEQNRVTLINSDTSMEKSLGIPMFITEKSAKERCHCKIICVEKEQLLAIYNSERLSAYMGEKVGDTIAYQVHLQSRISEISNVIYTTASFLLRVLMGQTVFESFRHISHIIINDVHTHNALSDILLYELKKGLKFHHNLKVILLSNSKYNEEFLSYLGEGEELRINNTSQLIDVMYLDEIVSVIAKERAAYPRSYAYSEPPTILNDIQVNRIKADKSLENYNTTGSTQAFESFLYLVHSEFVPADYQHSVFRYTALKIAEKFCHKVHMQKLLCLSSDPLLESKPYLHDIDSKSRIEIDDNTVPKNYSDHSNKHSEVIDYELIVDIIRMLTTKQEWKTGNDICMQLSNNIWCHQEGTNLEITI